MHSRLILLLFVFFSVIGQKIYSQDKPQANPVFNYGLGVGITALSTNFYEVYNGASALTNKSYKNKVGYNLNIFAKINLGRFFMQSEIAGNSYEHDLFFDLTDANNTYSNLINLSAKSYSANSNILLGYNIVKNNPFILNISAGPSFKYIYKINYQVNNQEYIVKNPQYIHYKYSGIVGFTIVISKLYFNIRYELNLPDTDIHLDEIPEIPELLQNIYIHKNENILSFSLGFSFGN
jgi:hypothetical protein